ncbi:Dnase i-like superfamily protein, partial [Thalictrum thalictroides]
MLTVVYGRNGRPDRVKLWDDLSVISQSVTTPWTLMGDFNACKDTCENIGGNPLHPRETIDFNEFLVNNDLADLSSKGAFYTWSNKSRTNARTLTKIDRCLVNPLWLTQYKDSYVDFANPGVSDHCPILMRWNEHIKRHGSFKFFNHWVDNPSFLPLVEEVWNTRQIGNPMMRLTSKLRLLKSRLKTWSK